MPVADLIAALKARWRLELLITLIVAVIAIAASLAMPRTYAATATLLLDERAPDPGGASEAPAPVDLAQVLATQADIIRSDDVARTVVEQQNLLADPVEAANWRKATGGGIPEDSWLAQNLLSNLSVTFVESSSVLAIRYVSDKPQQAARFANAFAQAYLDARLRMMTDPAKTYAKWFEAHIHDVRQNLTIAQDRLAQFQRDHGILGSESINAEGDRLTALSQQLAQSEASQADAAARAGPNRAASPDVQASAVLTQLRGQIAEKAANVAQLSAKLGPLHPQLVAAQGELDTLRAELRAETATLAQSLAVANTSSADRSAQLRELVETQRAKMFALQGDRSELEVRQRDVQSASAAYDAVNQRLSAMRLQTDLPRANVRQLDQASAPLLSFSPNIPLRAILGVFLGLMLAVSVAAALEWLQPKLRTRAGLEQITGAQVLTVISFRSSRIFSALEMEAA